MVARHTQTPSPPTIRPLPPRQGGGGRYTLALCLALCLVLSLALAVAAASPFTDPNRYGESLSIDPLPDGKLLLALDFSSTRSLNDSDPKQQHHFSTFPRTLAQVLDHYHVEALDLTLTQGRWQYRRWGIPTEGRGAPSGADLRVWLRSDQARNASITDSAGLNQRWLALTNALSGLFCGSLNFLDQTMTTTPTHAWSDLRVARPNVPTVMRHGALAREAVCTENLTPWTKLLPCGTRRGIARLLNGYRVFDANYNSIQTRVRSHCFPASAGGRCVQTLEQSVVLVLDPMRGSESPDWTLVGLLDRSLDGPCPLATQPTSVHVTLPDNVSEGEVKVFPQGEYTEKKINGRRVAVFNLDKKLELRMEYVHPEAAGKQYRLSPSSESAASAPLHISRFTTGSNLDAGTLHLTASNPTSAAVPMTVYQTLPWFLRAHLHTMHVDCNGTEVRPRPWRHQHAVDRQRPTVMELGWTVPAHATCAWRVDFEKAFLHFTEHRPDAHRGFEIPAALITMPAPPDARHFPTVDVRPDTVRMFTDIGQVQLPTPDFSMPYNVITFTCTVLAFYFGTMFALTVNRVYSYRMVDEGKVDKKGNPVLRPQVVTTQQRVRVAVDRVKRAARASRRWSASGLREETSVKTE